MSALYPKVDILELDKAGYYLKHTAAMTSEGLHRKSDIAAQLGVRDMRIAELEARVSELLACVKLVLETDALQGWACEATDGEESILDSLRRAVGVKS